jgi:hypothetical protein
VSGSTSSQLGRRFDSSAGHWRIRMDASSLTNSCHVLLLPVLGSSVTELKLTPFLSSVMEQSAMTDVKAYDGKS